MYLPTLRLGENVSGSGTAALDGDGGRRGKMKCGREVPAGVDAFLEADDGGPGILKRCATGEAIWGEESGSGVEGSKGT